ncbi:MAG: zinc-dependent metalloprotease, partial [Chitinophagales bacterium]
GVGSNDIGLDRGQLGDTRIVKFERSGNKVLLVQPNYDYRAVSNNDAERKSVEQAFAQSVIWGFKVESEEKGKVLIDATDFLLRDAHGVSNTLQRNGQGSYRKDGSRSAIYLPMCKNFPKNSELEATLTFTGDPKDWYIRSVTPSADAVTVRMHHSFIELPDDNYEPRAFDIRAGYFQLSYQDYATPIDEPLVKRLIARHRLEKKDPTAKISEAVEPIVYYVDAGAPEPIRSALIEGASWWNQAFEAAGYKDAFQVKVMPEDADPMDVRYNLIQWVHRSTRGWSYGASVKDPRTGEIIKGHVSLGSLRVRQDFLIAQGLIAPYETGQPASDEMLNMALARLRQLSAHEVGHTIGLSHNFAASSNDRASVMDYPHPYVQTDKLNRMDFSDAYDVGIGLWDKRAVIYGYQDFPDGTNEAEALNDILDETFNKFNLRYISDQDARPQGGAHPYAHLWDNGADAVSELQRLSVVRTGALSRFGENSIPEGTPMADLEEVLVPLYLAHRYQVEAVAKLVGGVDYNYAVKGDSQQITRFVPVKEQTAAMDALLMTISPDYLALPENILALIPPKPSGLYRGRESFENRTGVTLDPITIAESSANKVIALLLHPQRAARLVEQHSRNVKYDGLNDMVNNLVDNTWKKNQTDAYKAEISRAVERLVLQHLMHLAANKNASGQARAVALLHINELEQWLKGQVNRTGDVAYKAHYTFALDQIHQYKNNPKAWNPTPPADLPDGSPIGCGHTH